MEPADGEAGAEVLTRLAQALVARYPDDPGRAVDDVAAVRSEVERMVQAGAPVAGGVDGLASLREALDAAGLRGLVSVGASLQALRAALRRLHGLVAAAVTLRVRRRPPAAGDAL
jgi:hypothetical protein